MLNIYYNFMQIHVLKKLLSFRQKVVFLKYNFHIIKKYKNHNFIEIYIGLRNKASHFTYLCPVLLLASHSLYCLYLDFQLMES